MKGQASVETLILLGALLVVVASLLYSGIGINEVEVVKSAARTGANNAIAGLNIEYGCEINISRVNFDAGIITISIFVKSEPPPTDNVIRENIKTEALRHIYNAMYGSFPVRVGNEVRTSNYTYKVEVTVVRVRK